MARPYLSARRRSRVWPTLAALVVAAAILSVIVFPRGDETNTRISSNVNVCRQAHECHVTLDRLLRTTDPQERILLAKAPKGSKPKLVAPRSGTNRSDSSQGATPSEGRGGRSEPQTRTNSPKRVPGRSDPGSKASSQPQPKPQTPAQTVPSPSSPPPPVPGITGATGLTGVVCSETDKLLKVPGC